MKKYLAIAAVPVALILIACGGAPNSTDNDTKNLNSRTNTTAAVADDSKKTIGDGDWEIGPKDNIAGGVISPGTYVITSMEDGSNCYWAMVRDFDQTLNSIITNGNIDPGKTKIVVVKKSYKGLTLDGACLAKKK